MIPGAAFSSNRLGGNILLSVHPVIGLGALFLGLTSCLLASPVVLGLIAAGLVVALILTGLEPMAQSRALRPWLPMVLIILAIHTFTTTASAPLGTPSWGGVLAGGKALLRVGCTVGWLALYSRVSSLDDLVGAFRWWLQPAERLGFPGQDLALVLAVAMGTAPVVLGEGRRIAAVVRLRRSGSTGQQSHRGGRSVGQWARRQLDRVRVVVPLLESLGRRAEALSLSLRSRRPGSEAVSHMSPPAWGLFGLLAWLLVLVGTSIGRKVIG